MGGSDRHKQRERERAEEAGGVEGRHRKEKRGKRDKSSSGREDRDKRSKEKREKKSRKEKRTAGEKEKKQKHHKRRKTQDEPISSEDESSESSASGGAGPLPESAARGGSIANSAMLSPPSSGLRKADTQSVERMLRSGSVSAEELRGLLGLLDAGEAVLLPIETDSVSRDRLGELSFALGLQREMLDDGTIAYSAHSDAALLLPQVEHLLDISADQLVTCAAAAAVHADTTDAIGAVGAVETIGPAGPPVRAQPAGEDGHGIAADASVSEQSASSKRVLGPTLPSSLEDALEQSAREAAELQARGDIDDGGGDGGDGEDGVVGPVLPTDLVLANAACDEGALWWQRGDAAPKPRADEVEKEEEPQARESWMTALPTGRSGVSAVLGEVRSLTGRGSWMTALPTGRSSDSALPAEVRLPGPEPVRFICSGSFNYVFKKAQSCVFRNIQSCIRECFAVYFGLLSHAFSNDLPCILEWPCTLRLAVPLLISNSVKLKSTTNVAQLLENVATR
eukprot:6212668-Pleurochrysis_carterae.AAC.4